MPPILSHMRNALAPHEPHIANATSMTLPVEFQDKMATQKTKNDHSVIMQISKLLVQIVLGISLV